jgi:hypothetical protein
MPKKHALSKRRLSVDLTEALRRVRELEVTNFELNKLVRDLKQANAARVDTSMIDSRIKLANALGQMIQATTDAVKFVIAKETL